MVFANYAALYEVATSILLSEARSHKSLVRDNEPYAVRWESEAGREARGWTSNNRSIGFPIERCFILRIEYSGEHGQHGC